MHAIEAKSSTGRSTAQSGRASWTWAGRRGGGKRDAAVGTGGVLGATMSVAQGPTALLSALIRPSIQHAQANEGDETSFWDRVNPFAETGNVVGAAQSGLANKTATGAKSVEVGGETLQVAGRGLGESAAALAEAAAALKASAGSGGGGGHSRGNDPTVPR